MPAELIRTSAIENRLPKSVNFSDSIGLKKERYINYGGILSQTTRNKSEFHGKYEQ